MPSGIGPIGPSSITPPGDSSSPNQTVNDILNELSALGVNFYTNKNQPTPAQVKQLAQTLLGQLGAVKSYLQSTMGADSSAIYGPGRLTDALNNAVNSGQVSSLFTMSPGNNTCFALQMVANDLGSSLDGRSIAQVGFLQLTWLNASVEIFGQSTTARTSEDIQNDFSANTDKSFQNMITDAQLPAALSYTVDNWDTNPQDCQAALKPTIDGCYNYFYGSS